MEKIQWKQDGRFFWGWLIVLLGLLMMTFAYVSFVSLTSVFVLPVTEALGFARGDFMTYLMILSIACVITSPIMGKIMAKGNMKLWMSLACLLGFLGYLGFSRSSSLTAFYLFAVILGIGFAMTAPMPVSILINNWFGGRIRGTANGIAFLGSGLGGFILAPVINSVIVAHGWRTGYIALGMVFLIVLLPSVLIFCVKKPEDKGFRRMGETEDESLDNQPVKKGLDLKEAKGTAELWTALISTTLVVFASSALLANSVSYFVECGIDQTRAASLHGLMLGSLVIGKPLVGMFCDKVGIKIGAAVTTLVFMLTFLALFILNAGPNILVYLVILCYCLGGPTITVVPPLMVNGLFGEKDYGTIVGMMNMFTSIGGAFGGMIAAKVYDFTGGYELFWICASGGVLAAALLRLISFRMNVKHHTW